MNYDKIKKAFNLLGIQKPVGVVSFTNDRSKYLTRSKTISTNKKSVPAGCSFWEMASKKIFSTTSTDHAGCSVGMYTHNLISKIEDKERLMEDLALMKKVDYVRQQEIPNIPSLKKKNKYIVYGSLDNFGSNAVRKSPIKPSAFFVFANNEQGLAITEAVTRVDGCFPQAMGRPSCAVIPQVINSGNTAVSFGCCGARAYVAGMGSQNHLWVFPAKKIDGYAKEFISFSKANQFLGKTHETRQIKFMVGSNVEIKDVATEIAGQTKKNNKK